MLKFIERIKDWVCADIPKPISEEEHQAAIEENVRDVVRALARGNNSLQQGYYIMEEDLNQLREENRNYSFV